MDLSGRPHIKDINYEKLAKLTENYVSSDISLIVDEAARTAVLENKPIDQVMILNVISSFKPSITNEELDYFRSLAED
jgi:transitional endoplasmic reticulum ATPase